MEVHVNWSALWLAYERLVGGSDGSFACLQAKPADTVLLHIGGQGLRPSEVEASEEEIEAEGVLLLVDVPQK